MCAFNDMINNWLALLVGVTALVFGVKMIWDQPAPPEATGNVYRAITFVVAAGGFWFAFLAEFDENKMERATRNFSSAVSGLNQSCASSPGFPYVMTAFAVCLTLAFLFYLARSLQPQNK